MRIDEIMIGNKCKGGKEQRISKSHHKINREGYKSCVRVYEGFRIPLFWALENMGFGNRRWHPRWRARTTRTLAYLFKHTIKTWPTALQARDASSPPYSYSWLKDE